MICFICLNNRVDEALLLTVYMLYVMQEALFLDFLVIKFLWKYVHFEDL